MARTKTKLKVHEYPAPTNKRVIEGLNKLMEAAKRGEITGYAISFEYHDPKLGVGWESRGIAWSSAIVGGLEKVKFELLRDF